MSRIAPGRRAHPFTPGAVALAIMALAVVLPGTVATTALYVVTGLLAVLTGAARAVRLGLAVIVPLGVLLFIMQGVFGADPRIAAPVFGTLSQSGLAWTASQTSRLAAIVTASIGFATLFDPHRFLQAAIARRWPFGAAFLVVASLDAAERLGEQARRLREAQRTRGVAVRGSLLIRARALPALVFPLLLTSLTEADDRALALETRGLTLPGHRTALDPPADTAADRAVRWLAAAAVAAACVWRVMAR